MDISDGELAPQEMRIRWRSLFSIPIPRIDHRHKMIMEFLRVFAIVPPALEQALGVRCGLRGSNLITISPRATPSHILPTYLSSHPFVFVISYSPGSFSPLS
jgi:hypothetical protein